MKLQLVDLITSESDKYTVLCVQILWNYSAILQREQTAKSSSE